MKQPPLSQPGDDAPPINATPLGRFPQALQTSDHPDKPHAYFEGFYADTETSDLWGIGGLAPV